MKLLGHTYSKIRKDKNGENVPFLEIIEVVLIHCTVVNNSYQQNSRALYTIVPNKAFGQFWHISPENFVFSKTFDSEFLHIEVWFTDQNSNPLEIEDKINVILIINESTICRNDTEFSSIMIQNICQRLWISVFC